MKFEQRLLQWLEFAKTYDVYSPFDESLAGDELTKEQEQRLDCIQFARFCDNNKVLPEVMGGLMRLAHVAEVHGVNNCNIPNYNKNKIVDRAMEAVERHMLTMGWTCYWPGLCPCAKDQDGREIHLMRSYNDDERDDEREQKEFAAAVMACQYHKVRFGVTFTAQTESGLTACMQRYYALPKHKRRGIYSVTPSTMWKKNKNI